jgi:hypothetical protein
MVASSVLTITGNLHTAVKFTIGLLLTVGGFGMFLLSRLFLVRNSYAILAGIALVWSTWTTSNWLIRGAMAEFSAAMLVPWVLISYFRATDRRQNLDFAALGFGLQLLIFAHSLIGAACALILACVHLIDLIRARRLPTRGAIASFLAGTTSLALVASLPIAVFLPTVQVRSIVPPSLLPSSNIQPLIAYIPNYEYFWSRQDFELSFQLDLLVILFFAIALAVFMWLFRQQHVRAYWAYRLRDEFLPFSASSSKPLKPLTPTLSLSWIAGICVTLLLPLSRTLWTNVRAFDFLQFPWRLLSILTPCLILLSILAIESVTTRTAREARMSFAVGALGFLIAFSTHLMMHYSQANISTIKVWPTEVTPDLYFSFSMFGEYYPINASFPAPYENELSVANAESGCVTSRLDLTGPEAAKQTFKVSCENETWAILPLYVSDYHSVTAHSDLESGAGDICWRSVDGFLNVLISGEKLVHVSAPTIKNVVVGVLSGATWTDRKNDEPCVETAQ